MAQLDQVLHGQALGRGEVEIDKADAGVVGAVADEDEGIAAGAQLGDAFVVEFDLHEDKAFDDALLDHAAHVELFLGQGPHEEAVAAAAGDTHGAGDEVGLHDVEGAVHIGGDEKAENARALGAQAARHEIGMIAKFFHGGENTLACRFRNRAGAGQRHRTRC